MMAEPPPLVDVIQAGLFAVRTVGPASKSSQKVSALLEVHPDVAVGAGDGCGTGAGAGEGAGVGLGDGSGSGVIIDELEELDAPVEALPEKREHAAVSIKVRVKNALMQKRSRISVTLSPFTLTNSLG